MQGEGFAGSEKRWEPQVAGRSPRTLPHSGLGKLCPGRSCSQHIWHRCPDYLCTGIEHRGWVIWKVLEEANPTFCLRGHLSGEHVLRGMHACR